MQRGKFIVVDGIDGSGKGTVVRRLVSALYDANKRHHVALTREPYISPYNEEIRALLKAASDPRANAQKLTELFVADRRVHAKVIEGMLAQGWHVVCDRYKYSTLAYQQAQGVALDVLMKLHEGVLVPDLTLIIDVPAKVALERIGKDSQRPYHEVFEQADFQELLRQHFLRMPEQMPQERIVIVNGDQAPEAVFVEAWRHVQSAL